VLRRNFKSARPTSDAEAEDIERLAPYLISPEEAWRIFDTEARERLGMSGEEFLRKLESGEIVDDDTNRQVTFMTGLIPSHRRHER
jgi:hypothetical protein